MIEIDRKTEVIMYLRGKKNKPLGYIYFNYDEDINVMYVGWSKVNSSVDRFNKSRGRTIAIKRGNKSRNWIHNTNNMNDYISTVDAIKYDRLPFVLRDNITYYLTKAKIHFNIGDKRVMFVFPIIENNLVVSGDELFTEGKIETKTRYTKLVY